MIKILNQYTNAQMNEGCEDRYARVPCIGEYVEVFIDELTKFYYFKVTNVVQELNGDVYVFIDTSDEIKIRLG